MELNDLLPLQNKRPVAWFVNGTGAHSSVEDTSAASFPCYDDKHRAFTQHDQSYLVRLPLNIQVWFLGAQFLVQSPRAYWNPVGVKSNWNVDLHFRLCHMLGLCRLVSTINISNTLCALIYCKISYQPLPSFIICGGVGRKACSAPTAQLMIDF